MTGRNGTISEVKRGLIQCGYSEPLLRENYIYGDQAGNHTIPLAAFAKPVYDSRTSCISVITCNSSQQVTEGYVNDYRGFGSPVALVGCDEAVQWWTIGTRGAQHRETVPGVMVGEFFGKHKGDFAPAEILRAKNWGWVSKEQRQLDFVDFGLRPLLEEEMGEQLGRLMTRVIGLLQKGFAEEQLKHAESQRWIFNAGFRLLCAKILKNKDVGEFVPLDLADIDAVLEGVRRHYGAQEQLQIETKKQKTAIERSAGEIQQFASLSNLTTEAFGYMYENVLVDKKLRSALGIHATPSYLVDYIVWQLWPWIEKIPQDKRVVLEPACGHAPFLTGAMRLLRELFDGDGKAFHKYAKRNLVGIEMDSFAREIARLSLTMADIPNPNGWNIAEGDIYRGDVLNRRAKQATILLCNPPFEDFKPAEQKRYRREGQGLRSYNKAAEMLWRTLPHMPEASVFGVVLPRGFLGNKKLSDLRKMLVSEFRVFQILQLPKKVFRYANHESVVLIGRKEKVSVGQVRGAVDTVLYRHVCREGLEEFRGTYAAIDQCIPQSRFAERPLVDMRVVVLEDVWEYCVMNCQKLADVAQVGKGLEYAGRALPAGASTFDEKKFPGAIKGYALFDRDVKLHELPAEYWMNTADDVIRRPGWGKEIGQRQILMNYAPVSAQAWRLKALIDQKGRPVTSRFLVFRPKSSKWPLGALWGILNGPLANAFIYAHTTDRDIPAGTARRIPIPVVSGGSLERLEALVTEYFRLMEKADSGFDPESLEKARDTLLSIDAEVMRLYDLPPRMEKRILDLFQGIQRKGVDFEFKGYYPEGFESAIPLHEYLSEEYKRSTFQNVNKWVERNRSRDVIRAFEIAVDAFEDE